MVTASFGMAGYTRPMIPLLILSALAVDFLVRRGTPAWLVGLAAGAVTLAVNLPLVHLGEGIVWYGNVVMTAAVPGLILAAVAGWAGAAAAGALKDEEHQPRPVDEPTHKAVRA
ncbi:MAG: hypothetical protein M3511_15670 [Deinococcota bacterium]|nr:hypothetical protein [Deinococcota bacterium]